VKTRRGLLLIVPLLAVVVLSLVLAGCGSSGTSTTSGSTSVTSGTGSTSTTVAGATSTTGGAAAGVPNSIVTKLTGDEEVPAVQTDATATFTLMISLGTGSSGSTGSTTATTTGTSGGLGGLLPEGLKVSFKLEVNNIKDATAAHIHLGAKGQNGDVIYPLFTGPQKTGTFSGVLAEGPLDPSNLTGPYKGKTFADLVGAVLSGQTYVNVHTAAHPSGEIRGQIIIQMGEGSSTTVPAGSTGSTSAGSY
jgi:hypothetical protein